MYVHTYADSLTHASYILQCTWCLYLHLTFPKVANAMDEYGISYKITLNSAVEFGVVWDGPTEEGKVSFSLTHTNTHNYFALSFICGKVIMNSSSRMTQVPPQS